MPVAAEWCTLCYTDLRPAPREPAGVAVGNPPAPGPGPAEGSDAAGWPCAACGVRVPMSLAACPACGAGFLADLHEGAAPTGLPLLDRLAALATRDRMAALGIGLVACALFLLFWAVVGLLT